MAEQSFAAALNEQIANEFGAQQQYIGAAVYYDSETLPRLAAFFYRQASEERTHAMMMIQYLLDVDEEVRIPDIESKQNRYDDPVAPVKMSLEQEQRVGEEINALFKLARDADDFRAEQFMQWFVKEQVEEPLHELLRPEVVRIPRELEERVDLLADALLLLQRHLHGRHRIVVTGLLGLDVRDADLLVDVEQVLDHHHRVGALLARLPVEEGGEAGKRLRVVVDGGADVLLLGAELVGDLLVQGCGE